MQDSRWRISIRTDRAEIARLIESDPAGLRHGPFQAPAWIAAWSAFFPGVADLELFVATIDDAASGVPVFVLPLLRRRARGLVRISPWDLGVCDYNAPMIADDFRPTRAEMEGLWAALIAALPPCDLLEIEKLPPTIGAAADPLFDLAATRASNFTCHPLPIPADDGFAWLVAHRFHPSNRRSLVRKRRRLHGRGRLEFAELVGPAALEVLEPLLAWRRARFAHVNDPVELARSEDFYRTLFARADIARAHVLSFDGAPIAGCFGTCTGRSFQLLAVAHDPAFNNSSPGLLAIESSIELFAARGLEVYDFTIGGESYKAEFGVENVALREIRLARSAKGRIVLGLRAAKQWLKPHVKAVLARLRRRPAEDAAADG